MKAKRVKRRTLALIPDPLPPTTTYIRDVPIPDMETLPSVRRFLRNLLKATMREEINIKKARVLRDIAVSMADLTKHITAEAENAALRAAFEMAISQGVIARDALPANLFAGTSLESDFPIPISEQ